MRGIRGIRIIAGALKGRRLASPDWPGLRPTSDKLRETLFNVLGPAVVGARVLDGYSGTGAVGIEALSRGASHVTFVDSDRRATELVQSNLLHCGIKEGYAIIRVDFAGAAARLDGDRETVRHHLSRPSLRSRRDGVGHRRCRRTRIVGHAGDRRARQARRGACRGGEAEADAELVVRG